MYIPFNNTLSNLKTVKIFFAIKFTIYGTGSYPPGFIGWHFEILFIPKKPPFITPYLIIASFVYCEQVG